HTVGDQVEQNSFFAGWRVFQQLDQACGLFGVQRLGHDTLSGTLCYMFAVGFKHSFYPHQWSQKLIRDAIQKNNKPSASWLYGPLSRGSAVFLQKLFSKFYA